MGQGPTVEKNEGGACVVRLTCLQADYIRALSPAVRRQQAVSRSVGRKQFRACGRTVSGRRRPRQHQGPGIVLPTCSSRRTSRAHVVICPEAYPIARPPKLGVRVPGRLDWREQFHVHGFLPRALQPVRFVRRANAGGAQIRLSRDRSSARSARRS
jgi:hypothetical protein